MASWSKVKLSVLAACQTHYPRDNFKFALMQILCFLSDGSWICGISMCICKEFEKNLFLHQPIYLAKCWPHFFSPSRPFGILHFSPFWRNSMTHSMRKKCRPQITCSASRLTHMQRSAFRHCNNPLGKKGEEQTRPWKYIECAKLSMPHSSCSASYAHFNEQSHTCSACNATH